MKKSLLFSIVLFFGIKYSYSQELVKDGDMQSGTNWHTASPMGGSDEATFQFNYTDATPTLGEGGCLVITGLGQTRCLAYQAVTITPGHSYVFKGVFKNASSEAVLNSWVEILLSRNVPVDTADYGAGAGDYIYARNTWLAAPWGDMSSMDGSLIDEFQFSWKGAAVGANDSALTGTTITIPDTVTVTTWYVGLKAGIWNDVGGAPTFIYLFDNISLWDLAETPPTGIKDVLAPDNMLSTVYPTISGGIVNIKSKGSENLDYSVYNNVGAIIKSGKLTNEELSLDLSNIARGVYYINVTSDSQSETHD